MIAETRNLLPRQLARLQHGRARRDVDFGAIYGDLRHYSAASKTPPLSRIRRSSSGRKWRISPWIGHAAASPSAQMVWPSTRSEEHTSELQSLMRISYAVFCLKKKKQIKTSNCVTKKPYQYNTKQNTIQTNKTKLYKQQM